MPYKDPKEWRDLYRRYRNARMTWGPQAARDMSRLESSLSTKERNRLLEKQINQDYQLRMAELDQQMAIARMKREVSEINRYQSEQALQRQMMMMAFQMQLAQYQQVMEQQKMQQMHMNQMGMAQQRHELGQTVGAKDIWTQQQVGKRAEERYAHERGITGMQTRSAMDMEKARIAGQIELARVRGDIDATKTLMDHYNGLERIDIESQNRLQGIMAEQQLKNQWAQDERDWKARQAEEERKSRMQLLDKKQRGTAEIQRRGAQSKALERGITTSEKVLERASPAQRPAALKGLEEAQIRAQRHEGINIPRPKPPVPEKSTPSLLGLLALMARGGIPTK